MRFSRIFLYLSILSFSFLSLDASAQSTKVKGRVVDAVTGEGIPFAGVYFKNSSVGVTTDIDGWYALETRVDTLEFLSAYCLGYEEEVKHVSPHRFNTVNFSLNPLLNELNASVVKPDDRYMKYILGRIKEAKKRNNPELRPQYDCEIYSKNEFDLVNPQNPLVRNLLPKDFHFVYEYVDTSLVSGQPYLPVMITEANSHLFYSKDDPALRKEIVRASRISGIDEEKTVAQFTGGLYVKPNFYEDHINIFQVEIPSPLSDNGSTYYNYYLVDSLGIDGRKTYKIRFHPSKWVSSPTFDGEMSIDAADFALRDIHVKLKKGSNVNWVKDLAIDVENTLVGDSVWFYKQERIYMDFSVTMSDSTKIISFIGNRLVNYSEPSFMRSSLLGLLDNKAPVLMSKDVLTSDEEYWRNARPYPLSAKEQGIYEMVDSIKSVPLYKGTEKLVDMLVNGFYNFRHIGIGPYSSAFSFNDLEGNRVQMGFKTTKDLSRKFRLMGYGAYGFKDEAPKGGVVFERVFNNMPMRKLAFSYKHDVLQLGAGSFGFGNGDIMSSILTKRGGRKLSMINDLSLAYHYEWSQNTNMIMALESRRVFSNEYVPMVRTDGTWFNSVGYNQAHLRLRFSKDEIVTRGVFEKHYFFTEYPIVTIDLIGSMKGIGKNEYTFFRPELNVHYTWRVPPAGNSSIDFNAGTIIGAVPYPFLKIHEGNGTYTLRSRAFACMDYYEFASDRWATLFWEHDFKGFFLGKIPLLKKLQLREIAILRAAYGTIRDENNGIAGDPGFGSEMLFPSGMKKLDKPYVEMGVGITNILRVIRIDAVWRLTHRFDTVEGVRVPHDNRFVINVGFEFNL